MTDLPKNETADYHADSFSKSPSLSSSVAWEIEPSNSKAGSPRHGWLIHPKLGNHPKKASDEMRFGSLCHSMLLRKGSEYRVAPVFRTKDGKESNSFATTEAKNWVAQCESDGVIPISRQEESDAQECVVQWTKQLNDFKLSYLLKGQQYEKYLSWNDSVKIVVNASNKDFLGSTPEIECRAMLDILTEDWREIWDIKTMSRAHPRKIISKIIDEGLALRSEFYKRGVEKTKPELAGKVKHGFIFCSVEAPFAVIPVYELDGRFQLVGKKQVERSIQTWGECLRTNQWPLFKAIQRAEMPTWCFKDEILEEE